MKMIEKIQPFAIFVALTGCTPEPIPLDHPELNFELREALVQEISPHVDDWIELSPGEGSFLVVLTDQTGEDGGPAFAQLSVENGEMGVDHVLNIDRHVQTASKFREYGEDLGHEVLSLNGGGVPYLRFTTNSPAADVLGVLREVFQIDYALTVGIFGRVLEEE